MLLKAVRTKIKLQSPLQQHLELLLDRLRLLGEVILEDLRVLLQDVENGSLVEICDPQVDFSLVAQIIAPREKLCHVYSGLRDAVQILGYALLGRELPGIAKMVEELVRLEAIVVNYRGRRIMIVPLDSKDIATTSSILDPGPLFLLLPKARPFEISVSAMRLENDGIIHDDLFRIVFWFCLFAVPFRFVEGELGIVVLL